MWIGTKGRVVCVLPIAWATTVANLLAFRQIQRVATTGCGGGLMKDLLRGILVASIVASASASLSGCGNDDGGGGGGVTATGPVISFFGVTRADDTLLDASGTTGDGTPIFTRIAGVTGVASGFALVIEGRPGTSGLPAGTSSYQADLS